MRTIVKVSHRRGPMGHSMGSRPLASRSQEAEAGLYRLSRRGDRGSLGKKWREPRRLTVARVSFG